MDWQNKNLENQVKSIGGRRFIAPIDFKIKDHRDFLQASGNTSIPLSEPYHIYLSESEYHHAKNVLRIKNDTPVSVFDPDKQIEAIGYLKSADSKNSFIEVKYIQKSETIYPSLIIGLPKFKVAEKMVEKLTEIGSSNLLFFVADHSEAQNLNDKQINSKIERLTKIRNSALKQCYTMHSPKINLFKSLAKLIEYLKAAPSLSSSLNGYSFICEPSFYLNFKNEFSDEIPSPLTPIDIINNFNFESSSPIIAIGPEGGFSLEEQRLFFKMKFFLLSLGQNVLRVDTAGIVANTIFSIKKCQNNHE